MPDHAQPLAPCGLGIDAGGTATRWALCNGSGALLREGVAAPVSGLLLGDAAGRAQFAAVLQAIAATVVHSDGAHRASTVCAGISGFDAAQLPLLREMAAAAFAVEPAAVAAFSDIELTCRAACAPGACAVLMAGTGSIAACLDAEGTLQRAGGRGAVIDDAGSGHWIVREALRSVWRAEDVRPGAWRDSPLALRLFERIGGSDWAATRAFVYGATRGEVGTLALAVAQAAADDPAALRLLHAAGIELARLPRALAQRCGPMPLALTGRVFDLHPAVERGLLRALPASTAVHRHTEAAHIAAARLAAAQASNSARITP